MGSKSSAWAVGELSGAFPGLSWLRTGVVLFVAGQVLIFHVIYAVEAVHHALGVITVMVIEVRAGQQDD